MDDHQFEVYPCPQLEIDRIGSLFSILVLQK